MRRCADMRRWRDEHLHKQSAGEARKQLVHHRIVALLGCIWGLWGLYRHYIGLYGAYLGIKEKKREANV